MTGNIGRAVRIARNAVLTVGAALGLLIVVGLVAGPALGVRPVVITSGSMEPAIGTGDLVLTRSVPPADVEVGDVVTVRTSTDSHVTHRVVALHAGGAGQSVLTLRGDANLAPDAEQYVVSSADRMIVDVPHVGYLLAAMRTPGGLVVIGALSTLLLLLAVRGGGRADFPEPARHRGARRRTGRRATAAVAATTLAAGMPAAADAAPWTDDVAVSGTTFAAYDVPKPTIQSCTVTGPALGQKTATIVWAEVSVPHPIAYSAIIVETGQSLTVTDNGSTRQTQFSAGLLETVLNQTYNVRVTASLPAPGTSWTDTSNQPVTIGLLGLGLTCGVAS